MKILYFGGQKSGKSKLAEQKTLQIATSKPYYLATYDNSFKDEEMQKRVSNHKIKRAKKFHTIEQKCDLSKEITKKETYIIDCISMWIFNNMNKGEDWLLDELSKIEKIDANIVFVLNEVTSGVIPFEKESREFVDLTGIIGQKIAFICDEVYSVQFGIENRLK